MAKHKHSKAKRNPAPNPAYVTWGVCGVALAIVAYYGNKRLTQLQKELAVSQGSTLALAKSLEDKGVLPKSATAGLAGWIVEMRGS